MYLDNQGVRCDCCCVRKPEMQHEMWKVLCLLVGEGTIEQLVDSVVDGGGKYSGELCKLVCSCQLMAVGNAA